ncbi:MAG: DUF523 domain-containing protein [Comamonadaceae bacterium]|jgi:uncharacterized protein YbbK (DUF523 family)|nr:DUF523 domain-containing protein [Comamonadaceae bacterium]
MHPVLLSACLLGRPVRFDGAHQQSADPVLQRWLDQGRVVPLCPEVAGGLPVPRPAAEIARGAGGAQVLAGGARVLTRAGDDVSDAFIAGARQALALVQAHGIRVAVLKDGSPSCGASTVHDGTFTGTRIAGQGVTAALLREAGVQVFSELQFAAADALLSVLDRGAVK